MYKKIIIIISVILTLLTIYSIENVSNNNNKNICVNATPSTSKIIVLDAGHGKPDEGAVGIYGTTEEAINLKITLKLKAILEESGAQVILTRSDENGIYSSECTTIKSKKVSDIKNRVKIGNTEGVDIFISIHLNKFEREKYRGWQSFYQEKSEDSKALATCIQEGLNNEISEYHNERVPLKLSNIYIMDNVKAPTVTIECGFLSNKEEARLLEEDDYQSRLAWGIYIGIQEYFKQKETEG